MSTIIVAAFNRSTARFLRGENDGEMAEVATLICSEARLPEHELKGDAPSRAQDSFGTRHAYEPHTTKREKYTKQFAHEIAEWLDKARADHTYTRLVLVAPPDMLGAVRRSLSPQCRQMVVEECRKNLAHTNSAEIIAALSHTVQCLAAD